MESGNRRMGAPPGRLQGSSMFRCSVWPHRVEGLLLSLARLTGVSIATREREVGIEPVFVLVPATRFLAWRSHVMAGPCLPGRSALCIGVCGEATPGPGEPRLTLISPRLLLSSGRRGRGTSPSPASLVAGPQSSLVATEAVPGVQTIPGCHEQFPRRHSWRSIPSPHASSSAPWAREYGVGRAAAGTISAPDYRSATRCP